MTRRILIALALAAALAVTGWALLRHGPPPVVAWQGYAEADFLKIAPTQQGLITAVHVARGDRVVVGQPLFQQDDANDRAAADQAMHLLQQATNQLANLQSSARPTEIAAAEANLHDAQAARDKVRGDLQRSEALLKSGATTAQIVDQQTADLRSAAAKVAALQAQFDQAKAAFGRPAEVEAQIAAVEAARAALDQARWRVEQRAVSAETAGVVADVLALPGETVAAGAPVVSILPRENIFVRFFVPEPQLAQIHVGDRVAILCDNCPEEFSGTVSFIAPQAEYTPPFIFSETIRSKFVFLAEARPRRDQAALLNPGQPVTVRPLAEPP